MTRQERKALDREMPWRCIMRGVEEVIEQYTQTNIKWAERSRLPEDAFQPAMLHGRSGRRGPCELPVWSTPTRLAGIRPSDAGQMPEMAIVVAQTSPRCRGLS